MGEVAGEIVVADVKIRNLDDWVLASHRARAKAAGRSVEEELRYVLTESALAVRREWAERLRRLHEEQEARYGVLDDSTPGIREERDSWG
jgi:plasmid stability protein